MNFFGKKYKKKYFGTEYSTIVSLILPQLPYLFLILVFFFFHYNILFQGYYRSHADHTIIHFSNFYFVDGIFHDGEIPLWQPYRHLGALNINALCFFSPLMIILCRFFLWIMEITSMNSFSMYQVTFLSYFTGYILTFVFPCMLLAREVTANKLIHLVAFGAALFGSQIFLMVYIGVDILFYFPFVILFWVKIIKTSDNGKIIPYLSGLLISLSLAITNSNPGMSNIIITVYLIIGISALLTSQLPWAGIPHLYIRLKSALSINSKPTIALFVTSFIVALGLTTKGLSIFFRIGELESKNRTILTKSGYLNAISENYNYSNHIFPIIEDFLNVFSFNSDLLVKELPVPRLYFGVLAIFIFILMFRQVEKRRLFNFFLVSAIFIFLCSTNPKDGYNFILPFSYLLNPIFSLGSRHNNLITLFASPFVIICLCMTFDRFMSKYSFVTYPHFRKSFLFLIISSICSFAVYYDLNGYHPKLYIYWYVGVISLVITLLLYFPRKRVLKPYLTIPLVVTVIVIIETMSPFRDYIRTYYHPFPKDGGGFFGNERPIKDSIRGWPVPMRHTFPKQFNNEGLNITNNFYYRRNNAYFKFSSIEGYDDTEIFAKSKNIEDMPWLKKFSDRLFFINNLIHAKDHVEALHLTQRISESGKNNRYAVVERIPNTFISKDISFISSNEFDQDSNSAYTKKIPSPEIGAYTIPKNQFRNVGTDTDNRQIRLYSARLPENFPKYLTTNFLNKDYKDITVISKNGVKYNPTYFDLFQSPQRFQIGFQDYREIIISEDSESPQEVTITWRDRFKEFGLEIVEFTYNSLTLKTQTKSDNYLVYLDQNANEWEFYIDGLKQDIFTTNGIFKGVFVPKGTHELEFKYSDPLLTNFLVIYTLSSIIAWGLLLIVLYPPSDVSKSGYIANQ